MRKWPSLAWCLLSVSVITSPLVARAQTDGAPVPAPPEPPAAPTPPSESAPAAPSEPPAAPAPPAEPAPPPSAQPPAAPPAPTPPADAGPPSGEFPLPPSDSSSAKKKRALRPTDVPAPGVTPETPPAAEHPKKPSEGLFEANRSPDAAPAEKTADKADEEKTDQFKIGPVVGLGLPDLISFGGTLKLTRFLGAGLNIGLIPKVQLNYYGKATLSYQHYDIYGRLYPFGGGFFLGAGAGYATVDGTMASSYTAPTTILGVPLPAGSPTSLTATYSGNGSVRTLMLTALIGYFYTTKVGFSFGIDGGLQLPIAPSQIKFSSDLKTTPAEFNGLPLSAIRQVQSFRKDADDQVRSTLEKIGRTPLPTINLRIGWIL